MRSTGTDIDVERFSHCWIISGISENDFSQGGNQNPYTPNEDVYD